MQEVASTLHFSGKDVKGEHKAKHARTHCSHGHLLDEANSYYRKRDGLPYCRRCTLDQQKARRDRL